MHFIIIHIFILQMIQLYSKVNFSLIKFLEEIINKFKYMCCKEKYIRQFNEISLMLQILVHISIELVKVRVWLVAKLKQSLYSKLYVVLVFLGIRFLLYICAINDTHTLKIKFTKLHTFNGHSYINPRASKSYYRNSIIN